jgi:nitrite reductase (cytochrome c-552)
MADNDAPVTTDADTPAPRRPVTGALLAVLITAVLTFAVTALLVTIFNRKQEAKNPYLRVVNVDNNTTDPAVWGANWPRQFDSYQKTVDVTRTRYGGSEAMPQQKLDADPWLKRMYAGYAFSIDYRERRGHAYMLYDQQVTERVTKRPQPGACLHCHASVVPTWRRVGMAALAGQPATGPSAGPVEMDPFDFNWPAVMKGFEVMSTMRYVDAHAELLRTPDGSPNEARPGPGGSGVTTPTPANAAGTPAAAPTTQEVIAAHAGMGEAHPVSCVDCHDPQSMELRVTRPGFVRGIAALAESDAPVPHLPSVQRWRNGSRKHPYDPNADATRQEMRSFACAQCHVEYYCGPKETLLFPWNKGLRVENIEAYYDEHQFPDGTPFNDWKHAETGAPLYKAQHPEFELWSQGVHARAGVACADCHMPYVREGALKVSDHWVRSPLLMINRSCQPCHAVPEEELLARVETIQDRTRQLISRSSVALVDMLDAINAAQAAGAPAGELAKLHKLQRQAQWRLDFISSENSMGFHADQEAARVLGESIDYARQAQALATALRAPAVPATQPSTDQVIGATETGKAPPGPYLQRDAVPPIERNEPKQ